MHLRSAIRVWRAPHRAGEWWVLAGRAEPVTWPDRWGTVCRQPLSEAARRSAGTWRSQEAHHITHGHVIAGERTAGLQVVTPRRRRALFPRICSNPAGLRFRPSRSALTVGAMLASSSVAGPNGQSVPNST